MVVPNLNIPGGIAQSTLSGGQTSTASNDKLRSTIVDDHTQHLTGNESDPAQMQVSGDLGQRFISNKTQMFITKALRLNAEDNEVFRRNHRFRGQRESVKFNIQIQAILTKCVEYYAELAFRDQLLQATELLVGPVSNSNPTQSEVALTYHIQVQLAFKEWLILKASNVKWFL